MDGISIARRHLQMVIITRAALATPDKKVHQKLPNKKKTLWLISQPVKPPRYIQPRLNDY